MFVVVIDEADFWITVNGLKVSGARCVTGINEVGVGFEDFGYG